MRVSFFAHVMLMATPLVSLSDIRARGNEDVLERIKLRGVRGLEYSEIFSEPKLENQVDNGRSIHEETYTSEKVPIKISPNLFLYNESLKDITRRRLLEIEWDTTPENDIHNIQFSGYQDKQVEVKQWMVDYLNALNQIRMEEGVSNPLCFNEILMVSAQNHINDMLQNETIMLSHEGSDGRNSGERITRDGYTWAHYGATIFAQTNCTSNECSLANRPMFFSEKGLYTQFGLAREEQERAGGPRWYYIFATSEVDLCMGMDVSMLEWTAGTPTRPPTTEMYLPEAVPGDGAEFVEDWMISLLSLLNAERAHSGQDHFCYNKKLIQAAQKHNQDMSENSFVSHQGSDNSGPGARAAEFGYDTYSFMAENIAYNTDGFKEAMFAWMSSKSGHGYNIINPSAYHIGAASDESVGLYTLVVANYHAETCIPSIACESTVHANNDPIFDKYACSLCLQRQGQMQFGVMGCGFGIEWYKTGDITAKFELYMQFNNMDSQMVDNSNLEDFAASIQHPITELLERVVEGNNTVKIVSLGGIPVGGSHRLLQEINYLEVEYIRNIHFGRNLLQEDKSLEVEVQIEIQEDCKIYLECYNKDFADKIQEQVSAAVTDEIESGNLTTAVIEEATKNNVTALMNTTISLDPVITQESVIVEEDMFELTHFPTEMPTSVPTETPTTAVPTTVPTAGPTVDISVGSSSSKSSSKSSSRSGSSRRTRKL